MSGIIPLSLCMGNYMIDVIRSNNVKNIDWLLSISENVDKDADILFIMLVQREKYEMANHLYQKGYACPESQKEKFLKWLDKENK